MKIYSIPLYVIIFVCFHFACSSSKETVIKKNEKISIPELVQNVNDQSNSLKSLKASGNITIETPVDANSGSFKLNLLKPDSISLKINGPFGINAAKILVTRDTFIFYNAFENAAVTGQTTSRNLGSLLNLKIDFNEILALLSALPDFQREILDSLPSNYEDIDEEIIISFDSENEIHKYWVNKDNKYITRIAVFNNGKIQREERYQNYSQKNGLWLPRSIQVVLHQERQYLSLYYDEQEVNSSNLDFNFNIPEGIKIVHWK